MKKFIHLFIVGLFAFCLSDAYSDDLIDSVRSGRRQITQNTAPATSNLSLLNTAARPGIPSGTSATTTTRTGQVAARETVPLSDRSSRNAVQQNATVSSRTTANTQPRETSVIESRVSQRVPRIETQTQGARSSIQVPQGTRPSVTTNNNVKSAGQARATAVRSAVNTISANTKRSATQSKVSRSAVATLGTPESIKNHKKCREIYYSCMDEFCANKDAQLKRCACSSRINEFNSDKKKLSKVEESILDFNKRLITVNMDKEDAEAIFKETEGEVGFHQPDKSSSKQILDEISKKLKSNSSENDMDRNLSAISLSLNMDSAFDTIDSSFGTSTSSKSGTELYSAALPVCREMVLEVCDDEGLKIAENGYQMQIEQDCNTVKRAYENLETQALEKVREGSALLDISRLDIHQQRNADDILTCKKKMLDLMTNSSVCGDNLGKCLDVTGRYIDPSTGEAFLTVNLVNLGSVITRPEQNQKWTSAPGNDQFVKFLNDKKKYLEPAMANCQDISDQVWTDFIEDALAQIKLAQESKLEDMRQSCTTLTTQCLSTSEKSITDFDARALSIFGVAADKTINEMCAGVKMACTALLESANGDADWVGGMTEIATDKTYATIMQTCREVGKACIVQTCKSISGNFGLCENIESSVNRKSIIKRTSCWNDVVTCVAESGSDSLSRIMSKFNKIPSDETGWFYEENYISTTLTYADKKIVRTNTSANETCNTGEDCEYVYDICTDCGQLGKPDCASCRLAEKIWGNCEYPSSLELDYQDAHNMIKMTTHSQDTLLSWFAVNTRTEDRLDSCKDTSCPYGFRWAEQGCVDTSKLTSDGQTCSSPGVSFMISTIESKPWTNCCTTDKWDSVIRSKKPNCCADGSQPVFGIKKDEIGTSYLITDSPGSNDVLMCGDPTPGKTSSLMVAFYLTVNTGIYKSGLNYLVCINGEITEETKTNGTITRDQLVCEGKMIVVNSNTVVYQTPIYTIQTDGFDAYNGQQNYSYPRNQYNIAGGNCTFDFGTTPAWTSVTGGACDKIQNGNSVYPNSNNSLFIDY